MTTKSDPLEEDTQGVVFMYICHGEPRCDRVFPDGESKGKPCPWCYTVSNLDKMTGLEIQAAMEILH